jgi:hypothetical protein
MCPAVTADVAVQLPEPICPVDGCGELPPLPACWLPHAAVASARLVTTAARPCLANLDRESLPMITSFLAVADRRQRGEF